MPDASADDWITVAAAAHLIGLRPHAVYNLIDRGELRADITVGTSRPNGRRSIRLRRQDVDDYLKTARVKPGELRHLHPTWSWDRYRAWSNRQRSEGS